MDLMYADVRYEGDTFRSSIQVTNVSYTIIKIIMINNNNNNLFHNRNNVNSNNNNNNNK